MLSKTTEYAIRALVSVEISRQAGRRPGFKSIAKEIDAPEPYVAKILQILTRQGLLHSTRGRGGGFYFPEGNQEIYLYDVVLTMEGNRFFTKCAFGFSQCNSEIPCPLHNDYEDIRTSFISILKRETVRSLATKIKNGEAVLNRITE